MPRSLLGVGHCQARHAKDKIYTYIGPVLVSVNPFKKIPLYTDPIIQSYVGRYPHEVSPHIVAVAESAFRTHVDRCVFLSRLVSLVWLLSVPVPTAVGCDVWDSSGDVRV